MIKNITRTITLYRYIFAKMNIETLQAEEKRAVTYPGKISNREVQKLSEEFNMRFVGVIEETSTYEMPVEEFVRFAKKVD